MADDNKNIPPSAGEAAKAIVDEDKAMNENAQQVSEAKPVSYATPVQAKSNGGATGWKVATIVFAIAALGAGAACFYVATTKGGDASDSTGTKCAETIQNVEQTEKSETGDIATSASSDVVLKFKKSGISLNMGSKFTVLNSAYSQNPVGNPYEQIVLGGLSENTTGAQNIPSFATGNLPTYEYNEVNKSGYWMVMATLSVYEKSWWDAMGVDNDIAEAEANGVAPSYNIVYRDDNYIISYNHPQNVVSDEGWARDWEVATHDAFEAIFKDSANWSK